MEINLPKVLTQDELNYLVELAIKNPIGESWIAYAKLLTPEQKVFINNKIQSIKYEKSENRKSAHLEGQGMEQYKWASLKSSYEAHKFYGNMGQPETLQQYKDRYGVYPYGYDENGNKL